MRALATGSQLTTAGPTVVLLSRPICSKGAIRGANSSRFDPGSVWRPAEFGGGVTCRKPVSRLREPWSGVVFDGGQWGSVDRSGGQEVAGSNPASPTERTLSGHRLYAGGFATVAEWCRDFWVISWSKPSATPDSGLSTRPGHPDPGFTGLRP